MFLNNTYIPVHKCCGMEGLTSEIERNQDQKLECDLLEATANPKEEATYKIWRMLAAMPDDISRRQYSIDMNALIG